MVSVDVWYQGRVVKGYHCYETEQYQCDPYQSLSNGPEIYTLCDRYGLYMIAESNVESHGACEPFYRGERTLEQIVPGDNPDWKELLLDRGRSLYQRKESSFDSALVLRK